MEILFILAGITFYLYLFGFIIMILAFPFAVILELYLTKRMNSTYAIGLKRHLISILAYVFIASFIINNDINLQFYNFLFIFHIIPWCFVLWYYRHTRKWRKKLKNIEAYDKFQLLNTPHPDKLLLDTYPKKKFTLNNLLNYELEAQSQNLAPYIL